MESLVDAMTDRSHRAGDLVVTFGANVALGPELRVDLSNQDDLYINTMPLSLRTGIALQGLPGADMRAWYAMVSVLDLAQYVTLKEDQAAKMEPINALRFGVEVGLLLGKPSFPITVSTHIGVIPHVAFEGRAHAEYSAGVGVGAFVPFIDLN